MKTNKIYQGDCLEIMKTWPDGFVNCCVTSPPYWGLRDYGVDGQLGLEKTPEEYVSKMVAVFAEVKRVLKPEGTLWLNLGDSYMSGGGASRHQGYSDPKYTNGRNGNHIEPQSFKHPIIKPKDLVGIPWMVAFALRQDGWYLRQDIIWHKPNPMPESVRDRCTKSHEYIFLLSKQPKYYCDMEAIKEEANYDGRKDTVMKGSDKYKGHIMPNGSPQTVASSGHERWKENADGVKVRNKRSVWTVTTKPYSEAHFATFPPDLITPCVLAGCLKDGLVLDPFMGSGTTAMVAYENNRNYIGCELNPEYIKLNRAEKAKDTYALFETTGV